MKNLARTIFLICGLIATLSTAFAQNHPFQNIKLSDDARIDNLLSLMTLEEKIAHFSPRLPGIPRLGVKGTKIGEGLHGLALSGPANWAVKGKGASATTSFPQAIGLAQMWYPELHQQIAAWESDEARFLAQNEKYQSAGLILLAPNADLGRDIRWGRTEECYGEDAYLASVLTVAYVKGLQGDNPRYWKTASLMKHFLANSNENNRTVNSSDFNERLFREYYAYGFYKGVTEGGSRAYMAAYNKYNGIPCTVHPMLKDITVKEWGQNGIICTDGGAFQLLFTAHKYYNDLPTAAAACVKAGINMFLDDYKPSLKEAVQKDLITEAELTQVLRGTIRIMLKLGLLDSAKENPYASIGVANTTEPWSTKEAAALARKATVKSIVLMKNDGLLPLSKQIKSVAVIGPWSNAVVSDWYGGTPPYRVSIRDGIKNELGSDVKIFFAASNKADSAVIAARNADVAIVCVGNHPLSHGLGWGQNYVASDGREDVDRQAITLEQEDLVKLVKKANPKTVMVLVSSFPYAINWSKDNVPAILQVTHSSQELGNGVADVLFGIECPAGRLVQTWSASIDDLLPILDYDITHGKTYMYDKTKPLFAFGHGLSYTKFEYADLKLSKPTIWNGETVDVSVNVKNSGSVNSDEVMQLYVAFPESKVTRPIKALKGFKRIHIPAGQTVTVTIKLKAEELKYWDEQQHAFVLEPGIITIMVGGASDDIRLQEKVEVKSSKSTSSKRGRN